MFIACPVTFILEDAEWFDDVFEATESALDWSAELSGENVIVYEAIEGNYGYDFKPLSTISA
jgi:hypothetical protein